MLPGVRGRRRAAAGTAVSPEQAFARRLDRLTVFERLCVAAVARGFGALDDLANEVGEPATEVKRTCELLAKQGVLAVEFTGASTYNIAERRFRKWLRARMMARHSGA